MSITVWEAIFMLVVLKIPLIYLGVVVWWAVRAVPDPPAGDDGAGVALAPLGPCGWGDWKRRRLRRRGVRPRPRAPRGSGRVRAA